MGQFACIHFKQDNILISKKEIAQIREENHIGYISYRVDVPFSEEELTNRQWEKLERQLDAYNIEYIIMKNSKINRFENKVLVNDKELRPYLAKPILNYINRYNLINKNPLFIKVGIVAGDINQMVGVIGSLIDDITDLTIFSDTPYMYKELLKEIYQYSRLKARCVVPCSASLKGIDIIFDCSGVKNYAKWCSPKSIYIDINHYFTNRVTKFISYPPIIWYDFNIICDRQSVPMDILQSILLSQGISKRSIPVTFKKMNLSIGRAYTIGVS